MSNFLRVLIILGTAWLLGLVLMVGSLIRQRTVPDIIGLIGRQNTFPDEGRFSWWTHTAQKVGSAATTVSIGLAFIVLVALALTRLLPAPPTNESNAVRLNIIEQWIITHDSLHKARGVP
jgi:hypothetical protein